MRLLSWIVCVLSLASTLAAATKFGWRKTGRMAEPFEAITLTLPIQQKNLNVVENLFWQVSDPTSAMFGKFMTQEQVTELVRNDRGTFETIKYLTAQGVRDINVVGDSGSYVEAKMPIKLANELFGAEFSEYMHPNTDTKIYKTEKYSLPAALKGHVTYLPHVSYFPDVRSHAAFSKFGTLDQATNYVTPSLLNSYYGIDSNTVSHGATQCLFEALGQQFDNTDLNSFQNTFGLPVQNVSKIIGSDDPTDCFTTQGGEDCGEANLDVQYIMAVAQGAYTVYWSISNSSNDPFLDWAKAASADSNPPQVVSISYGGYEDNSDGDMTTFNTEVQKLGLRGVTVVVSAGDDGVANFLARDNSSYCGYYASFPASSPYVTAVGATQGPESGKTEVVCSSKTGGVITTGGGFSDVFSRPSYQDAKVKAFLQKTTAVSGYNTNGRGYPDVAILGFNYPVGIGGNFYLESGTSASAPVFAGMITLINDARLAAGKSVLGFINQALYSLDSSVWNDITTGDNKCTANQNICCTQGFTAVSGWDATSGLGSPKFAQLKAALKAL